jgi:HlyD family secretion protein
LEAALDSARAKLTVAQMVPEKAQADLASAHAAYAMAIARSASTRSKADETKRNYERKRLLTTSATLAQAAIDQASAEYQSAAALLQAAEAECAMKHGEVLAAEAALRMSQAEQQHAVGAVKQQTAALEQALVDLERTVIRAPVDGEIIGRDIDRGQTVAASLEAPTLFTIAQDLSQMELHAKIDEADIGRAQPGQRASFTVDAFPNRRFAGHIAQIRKAPETIQNVVTYTVVLAAENSDMALLPGMTAIVQVVIEHLDDVLKIPNAALRYRPPGHADAASDRTGGKIGDNTRPGRAATVWTLDAAGRPSPVRVRLGRTDAAATELIDGPLQPGQSVIVGTAFADPGISLFGFRLRAVTWPGR